MRLPTRRNDPDNGATTAEWLQGDPDQTRPYFGELRPGDDERAEQAEARAELAEQERDQISLSLDEAKGILEAERRKVRVLQDEVEELQETLKWFKSWTLPAGSRRLFDEPVLPAVPEHDLTLVEVGSTPLDTPETDWDEWLAAWDALPRRVPGEALAKLGADQ